MIILVLGMALGAIVGVVFTAIVMGEQVREKERAIDYYVAAWKQASCAQAREQDARGCRNLVNYAPLISYEPGGRHD